MALSAELHLMKDDSIQGTATIKDGVVVGDGAFGDLSQLTVFDEDDKEYEVADGESYLRNLPNSFANQLWYVTITDGTSAP